jgi:biotin carboxyl carrier protein
MEIKRKFKVTIDGEVFIVEVEEIGENVVSRVVKAPERISEETTIRLDSPESTESELVVAPLPGIITEIKVSIGDSVNEDTLLLLIEAMKMENEIYAPRIGRVNIIYVAPKQQVAKGEKLVLIS